MKKWMKIMAACLAAISITGTAFAVTTPYLNQEEYEENEKDSFYEDMGIVIENNPALGYLYYRNKDGKRIEATYYRNELTVEKNPYYESEDRIGYIDELFPYFKFDPRDTTIDNIKPGDNIFVRMSKDNVIKYISAYNEYIMVYGKVHTWDFEGQEANLTIEQENGALRVYDVSLNVPITKKGGSYSLSALKPGEWVKVLVAQKILGEGIVEEEVQEIVVDGDTRYISNVYRGDLVSADSYKNLLNVKNTQALGKTGWGSYKDIFSIKIDPKSVETYKGGNRISFEYAARNLRNTGGYVYVAAENRMGKENAVKLNFQDKFQKTLPFTTIIGVETSSIKLLSGENLSLSEDSIIVRDKRLVEPHSVMVGDYAQVVVSGENKAAVINITSPQTTGALQVYRGRIKKIQDREEFEVETVSLLDSNLWYFHPTPRTFTIDATTKFYTAEGPVAKGIESFLGYGENSSIGDVYTIVTLGDKALLITDVAYHTQSVKGVVYKTGEEEVQIKDVYYYQKDQKRWMLFSNKNTGTTIKLQPNSVIIKEGKVIPARLLESGDKVLGMVDANLKTATDGVTASILIVQ